MCGICGILDTRGDSEGRAHRVADMTAALVHRGPDDEGRYQDPDITLGFRRLAVIDSETGQQPIRLEVDNPSGWPSVYLLASALVGCLLSHGCARAARPAAGLRAALAAGLVVVFVVADVGPFVAWRAMSELGAGELDEAGRARLNRALSWNPIDPEPWTRHAEQLARDETTWGLAASWSSWSEGAYGRELLVPEPRVFERLERKLEAAANR